MNASELFMGKKLIRQYTENIIHLTEQWMDRSKNKSQNLGSCLVLNNVHNSFSIIVFSIEFSAIYLWIELFPIMFIKVSSQF